MIRSQHSNSLACLTDRRCRRDGNVPYTSASVGSAERRETDGASSFILQLSACWLRCVGLAAFLVVCRVPLGL